MNDEPVLTTTPLLTQQVGDCPEVAQVLGLRDAVIFTWYCAHDAGHEGQHEAYADGELLAYWDTGVHFTMQPR